VERVVDLFWMYLFTSFSRELDDTVEDFVNVK
jgi:hypothetical protein